MFDFTIANEVHVQYTYSTVCVMLPLMKGIMASSMLLSVLGLYTLKHCFRTYSTIGMTS